MTGQLSLFALPPCVRANPENPCDDCGIPTTPLGRRDPSEWYMVHKHLWAQAGMTDGFLCVGCLEDRLGRRLTPSDFTAALINEPGADTDRLAARKGQLRARQRATT